MDVDPLAIFFAIVRVAAFIVMIVFFAALYAGMTGQIKQDDMKRYSVEFGENIMNSEITAAPHIFDKKKMTDLNGKELAARSCGYAYKIIIENPKTKEKWEFGREPDNDYNRNVQPKMYDFITAEFDASVLVPDSERPANFYGTVDPAAMRLRLYRYFAGSLSCTIERAFELKGAQNLTMQSCSSGTCFAFRKNGNEACVFYKVPATGEIRYLDCKTMSGEINFEELYETSESLKEKGIDAGKPLNIVAYPLKERATCDEIKSAPSAYVAGGTDSVVTVVLCVENVK